MRFETIDETAPRIFPVSTLEDSLAMAKRKGATTDAGTAEIGARLAHLRKERGLTQQEMALRLGVAQPVVSYYESGALRLHGELVAKLALILRASADEILGLKAAKTEAAPRSRRLLKRLLAIEKLPRRDQEAIVRTLDAFLRRA
jgi:transcriptional regulator with XRE-family HTH domain